MRRAAIIAHGGIRRRTWRFNLQPATVTSQFVISRSRRGSRDSPATNEIAGEIGAGLMTKTDQDRLGKRAIWYARQIPIGNIHFSVLLVPLIGISNLRLQIFVIHRFASHFRFHKSDKQIRFHLCLCVCSLFFSLSLKILKLIFIIFSLS